LGNSGRKTLQKTAQINTGTLSEKGSCGHNLTFSRHFRKNIFDENITIARLLRTYILASLSVYFLQPLCSQIKFFLITLSTHGGCHREDKLRGRKIK
jgi:hypothetical protein